MKKRHILTRLCLGAIACASLAACNSKEEDNPFYEPSSQVAVTSFRLKANSKVLANLDSVYFTIDLKQGMIFNADSLPKGTDITKLIPVIRYSDNISGAQIEMIGGDVRNGTVDYLNSPTDSIDFSGIVTLKLIAQNPEYSRSYRLKVNVHKMDPDSLWWDKLALTKLPARMEAPRAQKSVAWKRQALSLIEESNGTFTLATADNPAAKWIKTQVALPFAPDLRSLTAAGDNLYMLATDGTLYKSADGNDWQTAGPKWSSITGAYGDALLGVRAESGRYIHTSYPDGTFPETELAGNFPVSGATAMHSFSSKWVEKPLTLLVGGRAADGTLLSTAWSFDGSAWGEISSIAPPPLEDAALVPYFMNRRGSNSWYSTEYSVWMLIGGRDAQGAPNHDIYVTYDNGVTWAKTLSNLGLPDYVPAMYALDALTFETPMNGSYNPAGWSEMPARGIRLPRSIDYTINGFDISWQCPYIYLIGGRDAGGKLCDTIWKGVINRLSFVPLI